ncbi:NUDIX domain-containing protein [Aestuariivivens sediminicola]|uniref:NUDIX domain-containing protein n=1 Tax=Aestuariivivens sediminicola TaxID=2913560 RepID=UPI001F59268F|nr:NUDIX domain-containing protein [Aestuariivivens sediminicola]
MKSTRIKNMKIELLSKKAYTLNNITFDYKLSKGKWVTQSRECYDRGDGAAILLYNKSKETIILVRQFRMPTLLNGNEDGFLVEVCAGLLDNQDPIACITRETEEETGYRVSHVKKVYEAYSSPGVMTEKMHFFIGEYTSDMKVNEGGGLEAEHEDIEVLEFSFKEAVSMLHKGEIKDSRTIVLLQYAIIHELL